MEPTLITLAQEAGGSLDDFLFRVRDAWWKSHRSDDGTPSPYVVDVFVDHVVVALWDGDNRRYFSVTLAVTDDAVTFGERATWQEVRLDYVPVTAMAESISLTLDLSEAAKGDKDGWYKGAIILVEGESANGNIYTQSALKSAVDIFEGAQLVADHESRNDEKDRPEGSVHAVIGKLERVRVGTTKEGAAATLADVYISAAESKFRTKVDEGILGALSIKGWGEGNRTKSGKFAVERFLQHPFTNVAMVTKPGVVGAGIVAESAPPDDDAAPDEDGDDQAVRESGDAPAAEVRQLVEADSMTQLEDITRERDTLLEENTRLFTEVRTAQATTQLTEALTGVPLPTHTLARVKEQAAPLVMAFATHGSEQTPEQLRAALDSIIAKERQYLAQLVRNGAPSGLTPMAGETGTSDAILTEAFKGLVPDAVLSVAVRGRVR